MTLVIEIMMGFAKLVSAAFVNMLVSNIYCFVLKMHNSKDNSGIIFNVNKTCGIKYFKQCT